MLGGIWNKDGKRDQYGTLNLLTPEVVRAARDEIQKGISISLNWPIQQPNPPALGRQKPGHSFKAVETSLTETSRAGLSFVVYEDILHMNTQSGSQWDGFKHYAHQDTRLYYHGQKHEEVPHSTDNGIHHWHERGSIVGREVLVDYARELQKAAAEQNLEFKPGDILLVRTGFTRWYNNLSQEQREPAMSEGMQFVSVSADEDETIPWLWNMHFAAVAGDTIAFETCPPLKIHEHCLAFWGMPIGELWVCHDDSGTLPVLANERDEQDLEKLSEICAAEGRWSFFLTSSPLNVIGGMASPPNVLAIL